MSELVMAAAGIGGALLKSGNVRCTTTADAAELTKNATERPVFLPREAAALCNLTRKSI